VCKNGVRVAAVAVLRGVIGDGELPQEDALTSYGEKLGLAFQITDDTLDYAADQKQLGKVLGKDLAEGKVTLPLICLIRKADPEERDHLRSVLQADAMSDGDLTYTLGLMEKYGSVSEALDRAQSLADEAKAALTVFPNSSSRRALSALADYVVQREM